MLSMCKTKRISKCKRFLVIISKIDIIWSSWTKSKFINYQLWTSYKMFLSLKYLFHFLPLCFTTSYHLLIALFLDTLERRKRWQPFDSFCFELLSFLPFSPFFLFATQESGGRGHGLPATSGDAGPVFY